MDTKSFHFSLVLEDVVENTLSDGVKVVLVDLIEHGVDQILNSFFFDGMEISWDELDDMGQPVLSDWGDHIN